MALDVERLSQSAAFPFPSAALMCYCLCLGRLCVFTHTSGNAIHLASLGQRQIVCACAYSVCQHCKRTWNRVWTEGGWEGPDPVLESSNPPQKRYCWTGGFLIYFTEHNENIVCHNWSMTWSDFSLLSQSFISECFCSKKKKVLWAAAKCGSTFKWEHTSLICFTVFKMQSQDRSITRLGSLAGQSGTHAQRSQTLKDQHLWAS